MSPSPASCTPAGTRRPSPIPCRGRVRVSECSWVLDNHINHSFHWIGTGIWIAADSELQNAVSSRHGSIIASYSNSAITTTEVFIFGSFAIAKLSIFLGSAPSLSARTSSSSPSSRISSLTATPSSSWVASPSPRLSDSLAARHRRGHITRPRRYHPSHSSSPSTSPSLRTTTSSTPGSVTSSIVTRSAPSTMSPALFT